MPVALPHYTWTFEKIIKGLEALALAIAKADYYLLRVTCQERVAHAPSLGQSQLTMQQMSQYMIAS